MLPVINGKDEVIHNLPTEIYLNGGSDSRQAVIEYWKQTHIPIEVIGNCIIKLKYLGFETNGEERRSTR